MALDKVRCPNCTAGLKSAGGFEAGQEVRCPKCEMDFVVEEPAGDAPMKKAKVLSVDDEPVEKPKKKKKRPVAEDEYDDGYSYRNSPLRYAILAVLVVVMCVLGYMLYLKKQREAAAAPAPGALERGVAGPHRHG